MLLSKLRPDLPEYEMGPRGPQPVVHRDIKPENMTISGKPRQRAVMRCKKCGKLGSRSDGCGTSHEPEVAGPRPAYTSPEQPLTAIAPTRNLKPTPGAVAAAKANIARRDAIKARSGGVVVTPSRRAPVVDDNPTARERWTASEIAVETSQAEMYKPDGELRAPSSSWDLEHGHGETGMATATRIDRDDPEELNFEAEGQ